MTSDLRMTLNYTVLEEIFLFTVLIILLLQAPLDWWEDIQQGKAKSEVQRFTSLEISKNYSIKKPKNCCNSGVYSHLEYSYCHNFTCW